LVDRLVIAGFGPYLRGRDLAGVVSVVVAG
jgi:hypothetical protein